MLDKKQASRVQPAGVGSKEAQQAAYVERHTNGWQWLTFSHAHRLLGMYRTKWRAERRKRAHDRSMKIDSKRRDWEEVCDSYNAPHQVASWYDSDLSRLRVSYYVRTEELVLFEKRGHTHWREVERWQFHPSRDDNRIIPEQIERQARDWLRRESEKRWPEKKQSCGSGCSKDYKNDGRPKTVRR